MSVAISAPDSSLHCLPPQRCQSIAEKWYNALLREFPIARALPAPVSVDDLALIVRALAQTGEWPLQRAGAHVAEAARHGCLGSLGPVASARALMRLREVVAAQTAQALAQLPEGREQRQLVEHLCRILEEAAVVLASRAPAHGPAVGENVVHCASRELLDTVADLIFVLSPSGHFTYANAHFERLLGCPPSDLLGRHVLSLVAPTCPLAAHEAFCAALRGQNDQETHELVLQRADGGQRVVETRLKSILQGDRLIARVGVARDIEPRKQAEQRLLRHNEQLEALNDVLMLSSRTNDLSGLLRQAAEQCRRVLGAERAGACFLSAEGELGRAGLRGCEICRTNGRLSVEPACAAAVAKLQVVIASDRGGNGTEEAVGATPLIAEGNCCGAMCFGGNAATLAPLLQESMEWLATAGRELGMVLENARLYAELQRQATTDAGTGVLSRSELHKRLSAEIRRATRDSHELCVMMFDVDELKAINDAHGHLAGDKALRCVAEVLQRCTRQEDSVGRYGGDEFAIILPETDLVSARCMAQRMEAEVERAVFEDQRGLLHGGLSVSGGVASRGPDDTESSLLGAADHACYERKRQRHRQTGHNAARAVAL